MRYRQDRQGFTLIEIAVVLAIIGLIVGGILGGQSILNGQRTRAVLVDAIAYSAAIQQFEQQYGALPGDMPTATRVFGNAEGLAATAECVAPTTVASGSVAGTNITATCNGNGDGLINEVNGEMYRAWQQLAAAGLVQGSYTGISLVAGGRGGTPGVNIPKGALTNTGYSLDSLGIVDAVSTSTQLYDGDYSNILVFGTASATAISAVSALTGGDASAIDRKADDGVPSLGNIRTYQATTSTNVPNCATNATAYNLASTTPVCALIFMRGFQNKTVR